jgi:prephenate dehydrogenase
MPDKLHITIVGLGLVGASAGLALRRYQDKLQVVGHDKAPEVAARAKSLGAVDRTDWNLINAVSGADRILLALPAAEIHPTLAAIAQDLQPGCLLVDTAEVKVPVLAWAAELLPPTVHLIGGHPILLAEEQSAAGARADLFVGKLFCLTPHPRTEDAAVHLAADLVEALGARPFFMDPAEHDGMIAAVENLPFVLAGALLEAASSSNAWQDMRRLAGGQFYSSTLLLPDDGKAAAAACVSNRENTVRWLDELIAALGRWRELLTVGEEEKLAQAFDRGLTARHAWLRAQASGNWSEEVPIEIPSTAARMGRLIGLGGLGKAGPKSKPPARGR